MDILNGIRVLDLSRFQGHDQIGDKAVFGLSAAVGHHSRVPGPFGHFHGLKRFGEGADLVDLDQDRVGDAVVDTLFQPLGVGYKQVVSYQLDLAPQPVGRQFPAVPIVLGHAVFDGDDRVAIHPLGPVIDHFLGGQLTAV